MPSNIDKISDNSINNMYNIIFYNRKTSTTFTVDVFKHIYMVEIYPILYKELSLPDSTELTIFCIKIIDKKLVKCEYNGTSRLSEMLELITKKQIPHFEIYYKITEHGNQVADMSPCKDIINSKVISGYKRFVHGEGEEVQIGDVNGGAYITIPANSGVTGTISIKTIKVTDDFFSQHGLPNMSSRNVTKGVAYNPDANKFVNKK